MESFLFDGSPLSNYLDESRNGESHHERLASTTGATAIRYAVSFAQSLPSIEILKAPYTALQSLPRNESFVKIWPAWVRDMKINNAPTSAFSFLEQFRYLIVASQLLSDHSNRSSHRIGTLPLPRLHDDRSPTDPTTDVLEATPIGIFVTVGLAYSTILLTRWVLDAFTHPPTGSQFAVRVVASTILLMVTSYLYQQQRVRLLRSNVMKTASGMISKLQDFEDVISMNAIRIQEKELLSQRYNSNRPLTPFSRSEGITNRPHRTSLRLATCESIIAVIDVLDESIRCLGVFAVSSDLEKYYDIYEIGRDNHTSREQSAGSPGFCALHDTNDVSSSIRNLRNTVKLLLCTLLAMNVEIHGLDLVKWSAVARRMASVSSIVESGMQKMQIALSDRKEYNLDQNASSEAGNSHHALESHARILISLSRRIRGVQTKTQLLCETVESVKDESEQQAGEDTHLAEQYRVLGFDLKQLMMEWEHGLEVWHPAHERQRDLLPPDRLSGGASLPSSLDGSTIVEDGPEDALHVLDGRLRSSSNTSEVSDVSEQQLLEGIAKPNVERMSREGRLAKMKEDQNRQQVARENGRTATSFMKELETVIKCRPSSSIGERVTST